MIFNQGQIQDMLSILKRYELVFIAGQLGLDYLSQSDKDILIAAGVNLDQYKNKKGVIEHAFLFGILAEAIGDARAKKMTFAQFQKFLASGNFIPLTEEEEFALQTVKNRAYTDITSLGSRMRTGLSNVVLRNSQQQSLIVQNMIKQKTIRAVKLRMGARGLAADLAETSQDWEVDWLRIAYFLTHEAYNSGRAQSILKEYGADAEVYFDVYPGACQRCRELYLTDPEDPDSEPIVFKLKDIIANGNNIGRKVKDWLPTISPTHPYCRCTINHKKSGFAWDAELRAFVKPIKKVSKNPKLKGVKLNIKITKSENDLLEKAHNHGEVHSNGKWYWESSANGGKGDWRTIKKNKSTLKDNDWKTLKSVKDCEDFIDKNINFINNVDLSSCTIEQANLIAKTLKEFSDKNILKEKYKFSLQTFKGDSLKGGSYTMMKHSWNQGVLTIKSDLDVQHKRFKDKERRRYLKTFKTQLNNLDDRVEYLESEIEINGKYLERNPNDKDVKDWVEKNNERLNNEKERLLYIRPDLVKKIDNPDFYIWNPKNKTSISNLVRDDLKGSLIHELGHVLNSDLQTNWNNYSKEVQDELIILKKKYDYYKDDDNHLLYQVGYNNLFEKLSNNSWNKISDYANYDGLEFFAEAFTKFYFKGETGIEEMDNLFKKIMK